MLLVVAASMVTYLIPNSGYNQHHRRKRPNPGGRRDLKVTLAETQAAVDRMVKSGRMPADALEGYLPQFVDQMIQERAIASAYERWESGSPMKRC